MKTTFQAQFALGRMIRYCGKKVRFFDSAHRVSLFLVAIGGSATFVAILSEFKLASTLLAGAIALISAIDMVVGFSEKAKIYSDLRNRYYDIYCEIISDENSEKRLAYYHESFARVERDCPPKSRVLDVICRNEEEVSQGFPQNENIHISWWRKAVCQIIDLDPNEWVTVKSREGTVKSHPVENNPEKSPLEN